MANINDFKSNFGQGVRPNLFRVRIFYPSGIPGFNISGRQAEFLAKGASMPASTVGQIEIPFLGRQLKVPGDRTFAEWTVTILGDPSFIHRNSLEAWMNLINSHVGNTGGQDSAQIYGSAQVEQLDREGTILKIYELKDIFPTEISAQDLDWSTNDSVEEFPVTFQVHYWQALTTT